MDFSKFKKISSDDKITILEHPNKHQIKISHKKLSPEFKAKLDELPMHMAKGGVSGPAKSSNKMPGSPTEPKQEEPSGPCQNKSCKSYGHAHPNCKCYGGYAEGGEAKNFCDDNRAHFKDCQYYAKGGPAKGTLPETVVEEQAPAPTSNPDDIQVPQYENSAPQMPPVQEENSPDFGPTSTMNVDPSPLERAKEHEQFLLQERQKVKDDLNNGHIKPETYKDLFDKKDTLGKIGTLFGMLVGGAGSGLSHQPNVLMQMMDNEINRDLEAQTKSAANRQNFLTIAQHGLANQANVTGQNILNDTNKFIYGKMGADLTALDHLSKIALSYPEGSPQRQKAMLTLATLGQSVDKSHASMLSQAAMAQAKTEALGGTGNTALMKTGLLGPEFKELGEDIESRTMGDPDFGQAKLPVPPEVKTELTGKKTYDQLAREYIDFAKKNQANWKNMNIPERLAVQKKGATMAANLQGAYRLKSKGGVYKEGEQHFIESIVPSQPVSWSSRISVLPKVEQTIQDNQTEANVLAKSYKIPFKGFQSNAKQTSPSEKAQSKEQIKIVNGVKYKRGKNGEAIEVK